MATQTKTNTTDGVPPASDLGNQIATTLASADSLAAQRLQAVAWVHQARAAQLSRTAASLKAQFGPDDAGVKSAEAAVAAAKEDASRAAIVNQQVSTPEPQVAVKGWALHGRVFDSQLRSVSGHTVFLVDSSKAFQQAFGFAYTDDSGYFLLNFTGSDGEGKTSSTVDRGSAATELFVAVVDSKAEPVYLGTSAFQPVVGSAAYQNITLSAGNQPLGDPPPDIRKISFPPSTSSKRKTKR